MHTNSLDQVDSQFLLAGFPVLGMPDKNRQVKYFSLNPFLPDAKHRCPLNCVYCVCHQDSQWHQNPRQFSGQTLPDGLLSDLLDRIFATPEGQNGFPISLCDYSDPFLPAHRERTLTILNALIDREAANMVYITTKVHPGTAYLQRLRTVLERPHALRVTVFFSLPPLKSGYEPVSIPARVLLLKELAEIGLPCCWYLRPLVEEWLDEDLFRQLARELLPVVADHVILSGLVLSTEIEQQLREHNLVVPAWDRLQSGSKQTLSSAFEGRLRQILAEVATEIEQTLGPVMSHRLCGTNGNHAYGCLICGKQDRYCQLFQLHHYHETVASADNQQLKQRLREQALAMRKNAGLNINIKGVY